MLGVKLSVDHVGQEVLNTHYIRAFELSYLKLHPSLVRNIQQIRSTRWRCALWWELCAYPDPDHSAWCGAGGVVDTYRSLGVNGGQGYLFGRPKSLVGDGSS